MVSCDQVHRSNKLTNSTGVHAVSKTSDDTTDNELRDSISTGLERTTNTQNQAPDDDAPSSTKTFTEHHGSDRSKETTLAVLEACIA